MVFGPAPFWRRWFATALLTTLAGPAAAFGFDDVARRAEQLAREPYRASTFVLPPELKALSYDGYRDIRFDPARALWRREKLPFELMFFHLGKYQTQPVAINEVTPQGVRHIAFDRRDFDYGRNRLSPQSWGDVGFAGFRVHYALNNPAYKDELVVFLGASYLRALGRGQHYGLSARGLGIDTAGAPGGQGEEFPRFTEFWIERPAPDATALVIHALLESPRAAGAYRFTVRPGDSTVIVVQARLFLREGITTLGLAPLTSMFQHGENQPRPGDFRPEVHDSDGLSIASSDGEWLWRPLSNPKQPLVTSFALRDPAGFGLMQRDRSFTSYEDLEARYEQRPSAWVEPQGAWGPGRVELLQLPTPDETNDNVVAYWVPERLPAPGQPLDFAYRLHWQGERQQRPPGGWAVQSRRGHGFREPDDIVDREVQFVVDFDGPALRALPPDATVEAVASTGPNGRVVERLAYRNPVTGGWRMTLRAERAHPAQPLELRAYLRHGAHALTETWTSILPSE
ncbi:MAG: glucan biosynthesis protein G [Piscinibacter sp.]|nr:glucan biosynthesis protein G [Piscinibacter sp.]